MRYVFLLLLGAVLASGCSSQRALVARQAHQIDSLRAANYTLREQALALQDSLIFFDDIDSGYYYRERRTLEDEINRLTYDLSVCRDGGRTLDVLPADALFEPGTATLTPAGAARLDALAGELQTQYTGHVVRVEGHTDSVPLGPSLADRYPSNWELSAARATTVVRYLIEQHELPSGQIEAVGYGATRPVARNDSAEGRRQNRRVRISVLLH